MLIKLTQKMDNYHFFNSIEKIYHEVKTLKQHVKI
jgi:hypothetical protein